MGFIHGANRHKAILCPERRDASSAAEHPVRDRSSARLCAALRVFVVAVALMALGTALGIIAIMSA
jgi:hypothetical protein